jgi:hypothetical protein
MVMRSLLRTGESTALLAMMSLGALVLWTGDTGAPLPIPDGAG